MMQEGKQKNFFQRHFKGIAMAVITTIPTIYTTLFLGSMWDPYGNVSDLPVAVVNLDQPVDYAGSTMAVGDELVDNLKESDALSFHFVDAQEAKDGLSDGTYYMAITIPEDFSANATTLMDDTPKKMELQYATNPGTNYIASKMSESAMEKLKAQVSATVTEEYTQTIFDQFAQVGDGMTDAADGASQIKDGAQQLSDGNTTISDNLTLLADSTLTFRDGSKTLESGLSDYTNGVVTVRDGAVTLSDGISTLADGTSSLASGADALQSGASQIKSGVSSYTDGVAQAYAGASQLTGNSSALSNGADAMNTGLAQLKAGSATLEAGIQQLSGSLDASLSEEQATQLQQVSAGLGQLNDGIQQLNTAVQSDELSGLGDLGTTLTQSLTAIGTSAQSAGAQLEALQTALTSMTATEVFQSLTPDQQQELLAGFSTPMETMAADISAIGTQVTTLSQQLSSLDTSAISTLQTSVSTLAANANVLLPGANTAISSLSSGMEQVQSAVDTGLLPGASAIDNGIAQLQSGSGSLSGGISAYTSGVGQLQSGLAQLQANSSALNSGATALSDGLDTLTASVPSLTDGIAQLQTGAKTLADGTQTLTDNNKTLLDGAAQLTDGASQIQDGASQLADGSNELGDGIQSLLDGSETLSASLQDGADTVNDVQLTDQTSDMFASPVQATETYETAVPNNGHAMAAYMMAVGLWVGCLAFCIMFSPKEERVRCKNGTVEFFKRLPVVWAIAIVQAILMVLLLHLFNGFEPAAFGRTILVAILTSLAFMSVVYCLNVYFGKIGSFILLVFMVLQLSGSAGTYPSELSAHFFRAIKPFMPFTYTVHAFRSTIASGLSITTDCLVFLGMIVVFSGLTILGLRLQLKHQEAVEKEEQRVAKLKPCTEL